MTRWAISDILECGWEEPANTSKKEKRTFARASGAVSWSHFARWWYSFGYRSVSQFAVELANRFVDDPCFDFVDHVATNFVSEHR